MSTFTNLARANAIGANSYLLRLEGRSVLLDCGLHPRLEGSDATPDLALLPPRLDAAILTHSHLDHAGALPVLRRARPDARVFMTAASAALNDVLLHNSVNVMQRRRDEVQAAEPLFSHREADLAARVWQEIPLGQPWSLGGERLAEPDEEPVTFQFEHAGHILGSCAALFHVGDRRVLYTGDINLEDQTVSRAARLPTEQVDALIIETTRGDYDRPADFKRANEEARFGHALAEALERGAVLIPVFALGKTQEVLAQLLRFRENGTLRRERPIYIGGLSTRITELHDQFAGSGEFHRKHSDLLRRLGTIKLMGAEAAAHFPRRGCIYALSSGMMTEGTLSHTFARKLLGLEQHSIFFVGYADPDSPAGRIKAAARGDLVELGQETPAQTLRCQTDKFDFSAHADRESIRDYVGRVAPKKVFLVHGDTPALEWFRQTLSTDLPNSEIVIPAPGVEIPLW
ncbi:MAG: MBL fold metallo-hydrolase [Verrucomicrobia bacterium]|nr:MBL fold metallo-hydrolase [Verrucomicrobiota bacterium]